MNIASLTFILLLFPLLLFLYYCIPRGGKDGFLLLASWLLVGWGDPMRLAVFLGYVLYDYGMGCLLGKLCEHRNISSILLGVSAVLQTAGLAAFRCMADDSSQLLFPLGISILTLQGLSYLIDIYRKRLTAEKRPLPVALYLSFFPVLFAGPLISYQEFSAQLKNRRCNVLRLGTGLGLFVKGLAEKVVLADALRHIYTQLNQTKPEAMSMLTAWMAVTAFSLSLYFELLGYSEMARGIAEGLGFQLPKNFHHPFFSISITRFTENWNITVNTWFQQRFRLLLFGNSSRKWQKYIGIILMWMLIGAWYGMQPTFLVWGILIGLLLTLEELCLRDVFFKTPMLGLLFTAVLMQFSWVLFLEKDFMGVFWYWKAMAGFGNGITDSFGRYFFAAYAPVILVCFYIATDLFRIIAEHTEQTKFGKKFVQLAPVGETILLIYCIASMLHGGSDAAMWLKL